jgi:hypothetical protein
MISPPRGLSQDATASLNELLLSEWSKSRTQPASSTLVEAMLQSVVLFPQLFQ